MLCADSASLESCNLEIKTKIEQKQIPLMAIALLIFIYGQIETPNWEKLVKIVFSYSIFWLASAYLSDLTLCAGTGLWSGVQILSNSLNFTWISTINVHLIWSEWSCAAVQLGHWTAERLFIFILLVAERMASFIDWEAIAWRVYGQLFGTIDSK